MWNNEKINEVLFFAIKAHQNQKMKYPADMPYSAHIVGVALTALNYAENDVDKEFMLQVALLHDTLEDTDVTFEELKDKFGVKVAQGVFALTKNESLSKDKQMSDCLERILQLNFKEVAIVKLADRCFNTRCVVPIWSNEKQDYYKNEAKMICDKLGKFCEPLKNKILENIK